jgi:hypothetical protein
MQGKKLVSIEVDDDLLERIETAIRHMPPGWNRTRVFEVGAVELLERLERKWNRGKPFSEPSPE